MGEVIIDRVLLAHQWWDLAGDAEMVLVNTGTIDTDNIIRIHSDDRG